MVWYVSIKTVLQFKVKQSKKKYILGQLGHRAKIKKLLYCNCMYVSKPKPKQLEMHTACLISTLGFFDPNHTVRE